MALFLMNVLFGKYIFLTIPKILMFALMSFAYFLLVVKIYSIRSFVFKVIASILLLALVVNYTFLGFCQYEFGERYASSVINSVLMSNMTEATEVAKLYGVYFIIGIILFIILFLFMKYLARTISNKYLNRLAIVSIITFILVYIVCHVVYKNKTIGNLGIKTVNERFFDVSPVRTYVYTYDLYKEMQGLLKDDAQMKYSLSLDKRDEDIFVVIIGESERKLNMSLYGYERDTTPKEEVEKQNMLVFNNAISPGFQTIMSVPFTLSRVDSTGVKYNDNIVVIAKEAGFDTYWLSNQTADGEKDFIKTKYARHAEHITLKSNVYDEELLPSIREAIGNKTDKKKVIFVHLYGSRPNFNGRYPKEKSFFKENTPLDQYDNSVRYTDEVVGDIMKELEEKKGSIIYYSDHAMSDYNGGIYRHQPAKESCQIPLYIWYSKESLTGKKLGIIDYPYPASGLYYLFLDWMGIRLGENEDVKSPLNQAYHSMPLDSIQVNKADRMVDPQMVYYIDLKSEEEKR